MRSSPTGCWSPTAAVCGMGVGTTAAAWVLWRSFVRGSGHRACTLYDPRLSGRAWLNVPVPRTHWMNFGWWTDNDNGADSDNGGNAAASDGNAFAAACRRLALVIGGEARLDARSSVLDVGCGCGDQALVFAGEFGVRRYVGVEPNAAQVDLARAKASEMVVSAAAAAPSLRFVCASAGALGDEALSSAPFDAVLAVDSAYHFESRAAFLELASALLKKGGRFVALDLVFPGGSSGEDDGPVGLLNRVGRAALAIVCALGGIPRCNQWTQREYERVLRRHYAQCEVRVCTERVVGGFRRFAIAHSRRLVAAGMPEAAAGMRRFRVAAALLDWASAWNLIDFVLVVAEK